MFFFYFWKKSLNENSSVITRKNNLIFFILAFVAKDAQIANEKWNGSTFCKSEINLKQTSVLWKKIHFQVLFSTGKRIIFIFFHTEWLIDPLPQNSCYMSIGTEISINLRPLQKSGAEYAFCTHILHTTCYSILASLQYYPFWFCRTALRLTLISSVPSLFFLCDTNSMHKTRIYFSVSSDLYWGRIGSSDGSNYVWWSMFVHLEPEIGCSSSITIRWTCSSLFDVQKMMFESPR